MADPNEAKTWTADQIKFQWWLALPKAERKPKTQWELSKQIGVGEDTLSDWKRLPGFRETVAGIARELVKDDVSQVLGTIRRKAIEGSPYHTNIFLAMAGLAGDVEAAGKGSHNDSQADQELYSKIDRIVSALEGHT